MALSFAPTTDFTDIVDGLEAVTLERKGATATEITNALQRKIRTYEIASATAAFTHGGTGGGLTYGDVRWHLPKSECTVTPRLGDKILDGSGARWTVLEVTEATMSTRWMCICRNKAVVHGLNDTITIERATYAKATSGVTEATWATWRTGVRARIQEVDARAQAQVGKRETRKQFDIFIEEDLDIKHTNRAKGPDGTYYRILGYIGTDDITGVQTIEAETW